MHSEIKKFWLNHRHHALFGPTLAGNYEVRIGEGPWYRLQTVCCGNQHRYQGQWYSEEEMLRIIRMKAFT